MLLLPLLLTGSVMFVDASATGANDGSSWADAYTDLQSALAAPLGPEIWVAAGTYRPSATGDRSVSFYINLGRRVHGGFDGTEATFDQRAGLFDQTILEGDLLGDDGPGFVNRGDNSIQVVVITGNATLDGFTIRGGYADGPHSRTIGGGMYAWIGSRVEVRACRFIDNFAQSAGGGGFLDCIPGATVEVSNCTFAGNAAGEGGGGVAASAFFDEVRIDRCRFLGNQSRSGGAFAGAGQIVGSDFSGNRARGGLGGGAIGGYSWLEIVNCAFSGNVATLTQEGGGAIHFTPFVVEPLPVLNSIFWKNVDAEGDGFPSQIRINPSCPYVRLQSSCVPEFHPTAQGAGNLRSDPEFADPLGPDGVAGTLDDDLSLRVGSPCIDRADDRFLVVLADVDLAGQPRAVDALSCGERGVLDIGAYENQVVTGTTNYCAAVPSSLGVPAILSGPCAVDPNAGAFAISAAPVPPGGGWFFFGPGRNEAPFGNGVLCVGGTLHRARFALPQGGVLAARIDLSDPRIAALLLPGTCWSFQAWYRDAAAGGAGFNLSDAIRLTIR